MCLASLVESDIARVRGLVVTLRSQSMLTTRFLNLVTLMYRVSSSRSLKMYSVF